MDFILSKHAKTVIYERKINIDDIKKVLEKPDMVIADKNDIKTEHRLGSIEHYGNRVLRVILNKGEEPVKIVTAYYDRSMRGKI